MIYTYYAAQYDELDALAIAIPETLSESQNFQKITLADKTRQ